MNKVIGSDKFGHLKDVACAHQIVASTDSLGFYMLGEAMPAALRFVKPFFDRRAPVLVHCYGGINRSVFVAVALLMLLDNMTLTNALRAVAAKRGRVLTNRSFRAQLLEVSAMTERLE